MSGSKIVMLAGAIWFFYALIKKPEQVAILLFTLIVADINVEMSPLNLRAGVTLALFIRISLDKNDGYPPFFSSGFARHIIFFFIFITIVSALNNTLNFGLIKEFMLTCLSVYLGYYYYYKTNSFHYLKIGIILGGLICFADLAYTYAFAGGFPVNRVHYLVTGSWEVFNHNFFGYVCGTAFIFLLSDYLTSSHTGKISVYVMPLMFLGVLLSTSRGALLAMILVAVVLIGKGLMSKKSGKRAYTIITVTVICVFICLFLFQILTTVLGVNGTFMDTVTARLIDEPIAMFNKFMGNRYDVANMDSMEWREEASSLAFKYFVNDIPFYEQLLGIGYGGFLIRDIGQGYDAHNGLLLLLIETGTIGFIIYFSLIGSFWIKLKRLRLSSPAFDGIVFILLYVTSHNKEMTSFFAFLIMGSLAAEIKYKSDLRKEGVDEEEIKVLQPSN